MALSHIQVTAFRQAASRVYLDRPIGDGIGTLSERMLHAIFKLYLCDDPSFHEVKVGRYVADILYDDHIWEIQTRRLDRLIPKLNAFLDTYRVTVVYPVAHSKTVAWIDPETKAMTKGRKSPKRENLFSCLYELFYIKEYLTHPNLSFQAILCDMEEFRTLTGYGPQKKKRAPRVERIPTNLVEEILLEGIEDYHVFLPQELPQEFTIQEYAKMAKIHASTASRGLQTLKYLGLVREAGKRGRAKLYAKCEVQDESL